MATAVWCVWATALTVVLLLPVSSMGGGELRMFHQVMVSYAKVSLSQMIYNGIPPAGANEGAYCSKTCLNLGWCNLWCPNPTAAACTYYNIIVMPTYLETDNTDAIPCFTKRPRDYVTNASITAGQPYDAIMSKENLIDGIYGFNMNECFRSSQTNIEKWFVLDLGAVTTFTYIRIIAQPNLQAFYHFRKLSLRVGTSPTQPYTGFSSYSYFGGFSGPAVGNEEVVLTSGRTVSARYIAGQMAPQSTTLTVCHVEVY
ncbi:hypothetical protein Hamer_G021918 [Homarus americanus]|uniref:F5/8 type C domain-containing protein n=1 Tax=Homarus americanus TaxID=6706 RepID=A0A8J5N6W2_HOMAM|nr:hypothetical protein Hamer_G021918 [Homarus americanus]